MSGIKRPTTDDDAGKSPPTSRSIRGRISTDVERLWHRYYPDHSDDWFEQEIQSLVRGSMHVLDVGAGSGLGLQAKHNLKGKCRRVVGIDIDPRVLENPNLDDAHIANVNALPFPDSSFDLIFHSMVAEHLEDPRQSFSEMARVLKSGCEIVFLTPSKFYYPMLLAQIVPTSWHRILVKRLGSGREEHDVFPTHYRANSESALRQIASYAGLECNVEHRSAPPGYLRFHPAAFMAGVAFERVIEHLFPPLRAQLLVRMRKS